MQNTRPLQLLAGLKLDPRPRAEAAHATLTSRLCRAAAWLAVVLMGTAFPGLGRAQDTFKPAAPVTYTERYEIYGGINFLNGQAGQSLPKRYNMGGGEGRFTYYITPKWGAVGDVRYEAGTTPVLPVAESYGIQIRPLVTQAIGMGGVQYHWKGNQRAALSLHALAGVTHGQFDHSTNSVNPELVGLYSNRTSPMGVAGGSLDLNRSAHLALRLSPEIVFERFGDETREFFSISAGVLYRFGAR